MNFNLVIRAATGLLGLFSTLSVASIVAGRVTTERDKKTWDVFLTTPLTGVEILRSKARVAVHGMLQTTSGRSRSSWVLGLVGGVLTPIGIALAAIDLGLLFWASLALGLYVAVRPGTTSGANSRAATGSLLALIVHMPLLAALLASPHELAVFATWSVSLRLDLVLAALAIPIVTGASACFFTRRTIDRFDEWVGRPIPFHYGEGRVAIARSRSLSQEGSALSPRIYEPADAVHFSPLRRGEYQVTGNEIGSRRAGCGSRRGRDEVELTGPVWPTARRVDAAAAPPVPSSAEGAAAPPEARCRRSGRPAGV